VHESTEQQYIEYVLEMYPELAVGGDKRRRSKRLFSIFCAPTPESGVRLKRSHVEDQSGHSGPENSEAVGTSPHIADYWQVIARRLWLVMLIFGVTTAAAI